MSDVLALTIPLGSRYPSKNHEGKDGNRFGRKSDEYRQLFDDVKEAAEREMARTGWTIAECECLTIVVRYMPNHLRADALNLAGCEANALTAAGVWTDDRLAQPVTLHIRHDDEGPHRVSIVVMKLYEPAHVRIVARGMEAEGRNRAAGSGRSMTARSRRDAPESGNKITENPEVAKMRNTATPQRERYTGGEVPDGKAVVDGWLVPRDEALAEVKRHFGGRRAS